MARITICPPTLTLLAVMVSAAVMCTLPPCSATVTTVPVTTPAAAAAVDMQPVPAAAGDIVPESSSTIPTTAEATPAAATASKKFPLAPPDIVEPAAGVVTALPVPVPETLPSSEGLGFGPNGFGTNGGFGGGGCCGGFGYNNGPFFFNAAPARSFNLRNGLAHLLLAVVAAMLYQ